VTPYNIPTTEVVTFDCPICGNSVVYPYFDYVEFTTTKSIGETIVIGLTGTGTNLCAWEVEDGDIVDKTGATCSHVFTTAGPHKIRLMSGFSAVSVITASNQKLTAITGASLLVNLTSVNTFGTNPNLVFSINCLPATVNTLRFDGDSYISGDIAKFTQLVYLYIPTSLITGSLDTISTDATMLIISYTGLTGTDIGRFTKLTMFVARHCNMNQARVNAIIDSAYAAKDNYVGVVNFNITNNVAPSAAQKAKADELRTAKGWTVAYDA